MSCRVKFKPQRYGRSLPERFWEKVRKGPDCWEWIGCRQASCGYGVIKVDGKVELAHRISWKLVNGDPQQLCVLHRCDNPPCVNPAHLFLGSHLENMRDRDFKERSKAKLKSVQIKAVRELFGRGIPVRRLMDKFGVSDSAIYRALSGKNQCA